MTLIFQNKLTGELRLEPVAPKREAWAANFLACYAWGRKMKVYNHPSKNVAFEDELERVMLRAS